MNRTHLIRAIGALVAARGYDLHTDSEERVSRTIALLPAAWLRPPRLEAAEGRRHGRLTYRVELSLIHPGAKASSERRDELRERAEGELLSLFTELSRDPKVVAVERLSVRPDSVACVPCGEVALTARVDVVTFF